MSERNHVGHLIQRARHRKHLTQQQLADELGVSKPTVARWESGDHFPLRHTGAIEEALEITLPGPEAAAGDPVRRCAECGYIEARCACRIPAAREDVPA